MPKNLVGSMVRKEEMNCALKLGQIIALVALSAGTCMRAGIVQPFGANAAFDIIKFNYKC